MKQATYIIKDNAVDSINQLALTLLEKLDNHAPTERQVQLATQLVRDQIDGLSRTIKMVCTRPNHNVGYRIAARFYHQLLP